jgi:preprotein translocase subunit YajC
MFFNLITDAYAMGPTQATDGAAGGAQGMLMTFAPLVIIFAIFYFLLIRPQQKKAKQVKAMLDALKKGDKIVTAGGIYGVVESTEATTVVIKIAENVKIKVGRSAISTIRTSSDE